MKQTQAKTHKQKTKQVHLYNLYNNDWGRGSQVG
jgi:hypothetical protein